MPARISDPVSKAFRYIHSYFRDRHSRSIIRLSRHVPFPSMLILIFASISTSIHAPLVNWLPWSLLKISGGPCFAKASFKASTQKSASFDHCPRTNGGQGLIVRQPPRQDLAAVPIHDRHQIEEPTAHRNVGNVRAPDLVRAINHHVAQQVWPDLMLWMLLAGIWLLVDRNQTHKPHQPTHTVTAAFMALPLHEACHSLTDRVFPQEMSREADATHTKAFPKTACPLSGSCFA